MAMRTIDFSPLFRHSVGVDRMQRLLDSALQHDASNAYPPYNIEQLGDDGYRITMAVAGFAPEYLDVTVTDNTLVVNGKIDRDGADDVTYLHRGIAGRAFERRFELAEHIKVAGADLVNGLLQIELKREVPEEKKPRSIAINTKAIAHQKAA
jgi:molecular chaperone IbpA